MASKVQLIGGKFQDSEGNLLVNGYLEFLLNQDSTVTGQGNVCAGIKIRIELDSAGNAASSSSTPPASNQSIWANFDGSNNPILLPTNSYYRVTGFRANGQPAWGPNNQQVLGDGGTFDLGTWVPNQVFSWQPPVQSTSISIDGEPVPNSNVNFESLDGSIVITDEGDGNINFEASGGGGSAPGDSFWGGYGIVRPTLVGSPTSLSPITGGVTDQKIAAVKFTIPVEVTVKSVIMGATNFNSGINGAVGLYDEDLNLVFQIHVVSPGTVTIFKTSISGSPVTVAPGNYYFAWTAVSTLFGCRSIQLDGVINAVLNGDAPDYRVAYSSLLSSGGVLPGTLGTLSALTLGPDTGTDVVPLAFFINT